MALAALAERVRNCGCVPLPRPPFVTQLHRPYHGAPACKGAFIKPGAAARADLYKPSPFSGGRAVVADGRATN